MEKQIPKELSCGTLTFNDKNQLLLVKPCNRLKWAIPKGHQELNETYEETAIRETFEETGIVVKIVKEIPGFVVKNDAYIKDVFVFVAKSINETPIPDNHEIECAQFFDLSNMPEIIPTQKKWLINAIKSITESL